MKYMIMLYGSQRDYDQLTGASSQSWSAPDVAKLHRFMTEWNNALVESGEFVDAQGLSDPVHARRISIRKGAPVVTDGPYAETQEVLAGYTVIDCAGIERATQIAAQLIDTPHPDDVTLGREWYVDVRPIAAAPAPDA